MKKISFDEFMSRDKKVHGDNYEYNQSYFVNMRTKVIVICKTHGKFSIHPQDLLAGHGCKKCAIDKHKKKICGVAINDVYGSKKMASYQKWVSMIKRCYSPKLKSRYPTYKDCSICEEWLIFSKFKSWFDLNYVEGYQLDKDILVKGNKIYSPTTCCFVPKQINILLLNRDNDRGKYKIGVTKNKYERFDASVSMQGSQVFLGSFDTELEAFNAYKNAKERHIRNVAEKYFQEGKITERVYNALMKYEVEITD